MTDTETKWTERVLAWRSSGQLAHSLSRDASLLTYLLRTIVVTVHVVESRLTNTSRRERPMTKTKKTGEVPARIRVALTPGDSVRIARELQELSQAKLASLTGIAQPTLSGIEKGWVTLGADRAE